MEIFVITTFLFSLFLAYKLYIILGIGEKVSDKKYTTKPKLPKLIGYSIPAWLLNYKPSFTQHEFDLMKKIKDLNIVEFKVNIANIYAIITEAYCNGDLATIKQLTKREVWQKIQANIEKREQTELNLNIEFSYKPEIKIEEVQSSPTTVIVKIKSLQFHIITDKNGIEKIESDTYARKVKEVWHVVKNSDSDLWKVSSIN